LTLQFTAVFAVPVTVAENCCVCPRNRVALAGSTLTFTTGGGVDGDADPVFPHPAISAELAIAATIASARSAREIFLLA